MEYGVHIYVYIYLYRGNIRIVIGIIKQVSILCRETRALVDIAVQAPRRTNPSGRAG